MTEQMSGEARVNQLEAEFAAMDAEEQNDG